LKPDERSAAKGIVGSADESVDDEERSIRAGWQWPNDRLTHTASRPWSLVWLLLSGEAAATGCAPETSRFTNQQVYRRGVMRPRTLRPLRLLVSVVPLPWMWDAPAVHGQRS